MPVTSLEKKIVKVILSELKERRGFDDWWHDIDSGMKEDIHDSLEKAVEEVLADWSL